MHIEPELNVRMLQTCDKRAISVKHRPECLLMPKLIQVDERFVITDKKEQNIKAANGVKLRTLVNAECPLQMFNGS